MRTELFLNEVNRLNDNLLTQLDAYELECVRKFDKEIDFKKAVNKDLIEINKFYNEASDYIQSSGSLKCKGMQLLEDTNLMAETMSGQLDLKSRQLETVLFNNSRIHFNNDCKVLTKVVFF